MSFIGKTGYHVGTSEVPMLPGRDRARPSDRKYIDNTRVREQETPDGRFKTAVSFWSILSDNSLAYGSR